MIQSLKDKVFTWSEIYSKKTGLDLNYFIKNGFWLFLRQFFEIVVGTTLFAVFARLATKEALGYFQFVMSVFAVVSIISIPGLNTSILRDVSRGYDGEYVPAVRKSFFWSLIGMPVIIIVGIYAYIFINHELGVILMAASIFFPFFYAPNTWTALLQGKGDYRKLTVFSIVQSLINSIATIAVIYFSNSQALFIITIYLLSFSVFNVVYYYKSLRYVQNKKTSGEAVKYGWFLTKINFFNSVGENADKLVIGVLLSPVSLALFSVVSAMPLKLKMAIKAVMGVTFPKMSQDNFTAAEFIKTKQGKFALLFIVIFSIGASIIYFFSVVPISRLFFGDKYADYYFYGKYFVVLVVAYMPLLIATWYLQAKKMSKAILYINIVNFFVKITTLIIGVKIWGIMGAIWIFNIDIVLLLFMNLVAIYIGDRKLTRLNLKQSKIPPA